ncbi:MAG: aminotransferase class V-fold PLP-dependent enzyme [Burkholderiaceae bacterium]
MVSLGLCAALREKDTILASVMFVNNEIGVVQDIAAFGDICRERKILFHVDSAQAAGRELPIDLQSLKVDLMSFSAHKVYGPKGVGALYVETKRGSGWKPRSTVAAATSAACDRAYQPIKSSAWARHLQARETRDGRGKPPYRCAARPLARWTSGDAGVYVSMTTSTPCAAQPERVSFNYVEGESLMMAVKDIAVSVVRPVPRPAWSLRMCCARSGRGELAHSSIRFTVGRFSTEEEIDYAVRLMRSRWQSCVRCRHSGKWCRKRVDLDSVQWSRLLTQEPRTPSRNRTESIVIKVREDSHVLQRKSHRPLRKPEERGLLR